MLKTFLNLLVPYLGLVIMISVTINAFEDTIEYLPRYYFPFALGAVLFFAGYIGICIKSINKN